MSKSILCIFLFNKEDTSKLIMFKKNNKSYNDNGIKF